MGPLLLVILTKYFASVSRKLYCVLFADDTYVFNSVNNIRKLINTLHIDLDKLYAWLKLNKLINIESLENTLLVFHELKAKIWILNFV